MRRPTGADLRTALDLLEAAAPVIVGICSAIAFIVAGYTAHTVVGHTVVGIALAFATWLLLPHSSERGGPTA